MDSNFEIDNISKQYWALDGNRFDKERYLWPNYIPGTFSNEIELIVSMCSNINWKLFKKINARDSFKNAPEEFSTFFNKIIELILKWKEDKYDNISDFKKSLLECIMLIQFINNCFLAFTEVQFIRKAVQNLLLVILWAVLKEKRLEDQFNRENYNIVIPYENKKQNMFFLPELFDCFLEVLDNFDKSKSDPLIMRYLENCLILFIDLDSTLESHEFLNALIDDKHLIVRAQNSHLIRKTEGSKLFFQLLEMLDFYVNFENSTLSNEYLKFSQHRKLVKLQNFAKEKFKDPMRKLWDPELKYSKNTLECIRNFEYIVNRLKEKDEKDLRSLAIELLILRESEKENYSKDDIISMFSYSYKKGTSALNRINKLALYPTEKLIYDENLIPDGFFSVEDNFALPKLTGQYLSFDDYMIRNFDLFHLEAAYRIKQDIEQCLRMMKPVQNEKGRVIFKGSSRMGLGIVNFKIVKIGKIGKIGIPEYGRNSPRPYKADVTVVNNTSELVKKEWENVAERDPCFLITVYPKVPFNHKYNNKKLMASQVGLMYVRGCKIEGLLDNEGKVMSELERRAKVQSMTGSTRTWRVELDPRQYDDDVISEDSPTKDVYNTFNIFMRRKPKENNFKAVLEAVRDLMNYPRVVPDWLQNILLGYNQPTDYSIKNLEYINEQDWDDTFLDIDHLKSSFPQYNVTVVPNNNESIDINSQFKLKFPRNIKDRSLVKIKMHSDQNVPNDDIEKPVIEVQPYRPLLKLPHKFIDPNRFTLPFKPIVFPGNKIPFTPTQIEAIRSGMQRGLTLVIGPPGTGKTDVAAQIINNLYRNYPDEKTLVVTHSNQALNQLIEKVMNLGINERHLIRLETLESGESFVQKELSELLKEFERLGFRINDFQSFDRKKFEFFKEFNIFPKWRGFALIQNMIYRFMGANYTENFSYNDFIEGFPFLGFFIPIQFQNEEAIRELFPGVSRDGDFEIAQACFQHFLDMFNRIDRLLACRHRNRKFKSDNYFVSHAKIIATTAADAALRRHYIAQLAYTYDNIVFEEAAQILEIEAFFPLLIRNTKHVKSNNLTRVIMIGDHNQLPPVIKNMVIHNYCNLSQSVFAHLVELKVPAVQLNAQGRSRSSIRNLYSWRYDFLEDLPTILNEKEYSLANPGLLYEYQLIDVPDYLGCGETEPTPHFIQNYGEAKYCVGLYMYMRAIGYPAAKITILTTYNGQKHLIRDVVNQTCPEIGFPSKITTVDKFQGQQNDYVILSLVRTKHVGHFRDIRRLVVALSSARLGLYIFCRTSLFSQCSELQKSFNILMQRETDLALVSGENYSIYEQSLGDAITMRTSDEEVESTDIHYMKDVEDMTLYIQAI